MGPQQETMGYSIPGHGMRCGIKAAIESYRENLILKRTIPGSVEQTGGFFAKLPEDEDRYVQKWLHSCGKVGIPVVEVPVAQALKQEPFLSKEVEAVYQVPDGAVDCFTMVVDVVADAVSHGAKAMTYHEVIEIMTEQNRAIGVQGSQYVYR